MTVTTFVKRKRKPSLYHPILKGKNNHLSDLEKKALELEFRYERMMNIKTEEPTGPSRSVTNLHHELCILWEKIYKENLNQRS